jgi:hypothetical protein
MFVGLRQVAVSIAADSPRLYQAAADSMPPGITAAP